MRDSVESRDEAELLYERIRLTLSFVESVQDCEPFGSAILAVAQKALASRSVRRLRLMARDVDALVATLAPHEREGLSAVLESRLRIDREKEHEERHKRVMAILRRGTLAGERERRHVIDFLEVEESRDEGSDDLDAIRRLLEQ